VKATVDIDTGGTFTDVFVTWNGRVVSAKAHTTPTRLASGITAAITEAAKSLGISTEELLSNAEIVRHSTTIATNALIQRTGPKLGLIATEGFEDLVLIGRGASWADGKTIPEQRHVSRVRKPVPLIPRDMTVGVKERIDFQGKILRPLDSEDAIEKVRYLVAKGAKGLVVCLLWSYMNPVHEQQIRGVIEQAYPDSMPVFLSSEICPKRNDYPRMVTTIVNAYLHELTWRELIGLGEELSSQGYKGKLMIVHNTGGMADIFHTTAIQTHNAGPVAGLVGAAYLGKQMGYDNIVITDMGGTSFDIGTVVAGSTRFYVWQPLIDEWWVNMTMLETKSVGAGGGSIARLNPLLGNRLDVGPQSAGSVPGPVAYDAGGTEPTVTDADIALGYIDPDYFHGGRRKLNKERAVAAIREKIAEPLGMGVEQAALLIKKVVDANMGDVIAKETRLRGYDPKEFVLFAYGGAGATHCSGYGFHAGMERLIVFPFSPVFSAFGSACMDIVHIYERSKRVQLLAPGPGGYLTDYQEFNEVVQGLKEGAINDVIAEGFPAQSIVFALELDMIYGGQLHVHRMMSPRLMLQSEADVREVCEQFGREYAAAYSPVMVYPQGGIEVYNFLLRATVPRPKVTLPIYPDKGKTPPQEALKGKREAFWEEYGGWRETPVFDQERLETGNVIEGPALVEAVSTTVVLPPGARISIDKYHNLIIERT
jgi:N-methylhydantoinase A/oxoprolinase/acetone carboxylase beta subunit